MIRLLLGKKLFITGKGRCNLTNACDIEEVFDNLEKNNFDFKVRYTIK